MSAEEVRGAQPSLFVFVAGFNRACGAVAGAERIRTEFDYGVLRERRRWDDLPEWHHRFAAEGLAAHTCRGAGSWRAPDPARRGDRDAPGGGEATGNRR